MFNFIIQTNATLIYNIGMVVDCVLCLTDMRMGVQTADEIEPRQSFNWYAD